MAPESDDRARLPFEPTKNRKKAAKPENPTPQTVVKQGSKPKANASKSSNQEMAIPDAVSKRMARRMAFFCGIPTSLGMATFFVAYWVVSHDWIKLPNVVVVLVSMGFFGLGVLGLTYGVLSASWDEETPGSLLGASEFGINWGRMTAAWRANK
ncbi:MAG TPA: PAM68 family protein [Candidatus Obscuribacterales bacterium]